MAIPIVQVNGCSIMSGEEEIKIAEAEAPSAEKSPNSMCDNLSHIMSNSKIFKCLRNKRTTANIPNNKTTGDSKLFLIQVLVAWIVICIPGNIFAGNIFYKYHHLISYQTNNSTNNSSNKPNESYVKHNNHLQQTTHSNSLDTSHLAHTLSYFTTSSTSTTQVKNFQEYLFTDC